MGTRAKNQGKIIDLWLKFGNDTGQQVETAKFLDWLHDKTDFFSAPCSTKIHLSQEGGLAQHSLNVYELLSEKAARYCLETPLSSIIVCGLGHDLCKANFYVRGKINVEENGVWREKEVWQVKDEFPAGHSEKSVFLLQNFFKLTQDEQLAIRWHMGAFDAGINYPNGYAFRHASKRLLVTLLFTADYEASKILDMRLGYEIVEQTPEALTVRLVRPWDRYPTLLSAVEGAFEELNEGGILKPGQRFFYYDLRDKPNEILHENGKFKDFAPDPGPASHAT